MIKTLISATHLKPETRQGPEAKLWLSVMYRAVLDMQGQVGRNSIDKYQETHIQTEAYNWIFSDKFEAGSCLWILDKFFDDPSSYMKILRQLALDVRAGKPVSKSGRNVGHTQKAHYRRKKTLDRTVLQ